MRGSSAYPGAMPAFEFLVLTAVRSGEVCELALAHVNSDRVEAAYRRSDLFDRRRVLMNDWAAYVA